MLRGLTRYQWLVIGAAWLGWGFDVFDAMLFNFVASNCIPTLLGLAHGTDEARTATGCIVGEQHSAMLDDDSVACREAEPRASNLGGEEGLEHASADLLGESRPGIVDLDGGIDRSLDPHLDTRGRDMDLAARGRRLAGVADHVEQDLLDPLRVDIDIERL